VGNAIGENDETFTLNLSDPVGATIAKAQAICTIQDDDGWWMNAAEPTDVTGDGNIIPLDALVLINDLNANGNGHELPWIAPGTTGHYYLDVNSDGIASAIDALLVINRLNSSTAAASANQSASIAQGLHAQNLTAARAVDVAMRSLGEETPQVADRTSSGGSHTARVPSSVSFAAPQEQRSLAGHDDDPSSDLDELIELIATSV
jgi:hypothetical protein